MPHSYYIVLKRRLDDRIREICAKALKAGDDSPGPLLRQLREILHRERDRLKQPPQQERRSA